MSFMASVFLPINLCRVNTLREHCSDDIVAAIVNDERGTNFSDRDIQSFAD